MAFLLKNLKEKYNNKPAKKSLLYGVLLGTLMTYTLYHLFQGNRGLFSLFKLKQIVKEEQIILEKLTNEEEIIKRRINLLRPQSLDLDMLDEQARRVLNAASENDVIVEADDILASKPN
jgi:cell division protein FtsB